MESKFEKVFEEFVYFTSATILIKFEGGYIMAKCDVCGKMSLVLENLEMC